MEVRVSVDDKYVHHHNLSFWAEKISNCVFQMNDYNQFKSINLN